MSRARPYPADARHLATHIRSAALHHGRVLPTFEPMLAVQPSLRALHGSWSLEPKLDGWRALVYLDETLTVRTRRGRDITGTLPELQPLPKGVQCRRVVLDGELIAGAGTASDFYRLGPRLARGRRTAAGGCPVTFVAFDVLWLDDASLCARPYLERRALLEQLGLQEGCWQTADTFDADPADLLAACRSLGVEGFVAKRQDSPYRPGRRSADWIKVKTDSWRDTHGRTRVA